MTVGLFNNFMTFLAIIFIRLKVLSEMYAKLWEWASMTGDTRDRMESIRQCLEKNDFR